MGTLNLNMTRRISNRRQWPVKRINHRDGSTTYKCVNCGAVLCHDEPGTIRLGVLPHVEGDEDDMEAGRCRRRTEKEAEK